MPIKLERVREVVSFAHLAAAFVLCAGFGAAQSGSYTYNRTVVIDHTKAPNTDQSDFPFLFSTTVLC
jgi:hypothetical protein